MKKYKWNTHKVIQETKDAVTIVFDTGQAAIAYLAGQYLNISCSIDGEQVSRSYSFSSAVSDKFPSITVKRIADGKMSNYLVDNAKHISEWDVEAPFGNFVLNPQFVKGPEIVFLAGGSGISPLFSMLKGIEGSVPKPLLLYSSSRQKIPSSGVSWKRCKRATDCMSFTRSVQMRKIYKIGIVSVVVFHSR